MRYLSLGRTSTLKHSCLTYKKHLPKCGTSRLRNKNEAIFLSVCPYATPPPQNTNHITSRKRKLLLASVFAHNHCMYGQWVCACWFGGMYFSALGTGETGGGSNLQLNLIRNALFESRSN